MKNTWEGINSTLNKAEDQISNLESKIAENTQLEQQEERIIIKNDDSVRSLWDTFKYTNICIMGVPEGEEGKQEVQNILEKIMTENFPNLVKEVDIQVQKAEGPKQDEPKEAHTKIHHN